MLNGCYSVDVYCDFCDRWERGVDGPMVHPTAIIGRTYTECVRQMKRRGWTLPQRNGEKWHRCPACTKENRRTVSPNNM